MCKAEAGTSTVLGPRQRMNKTSRLQFCVRMKEQAPKSAALKKNFTYRVENTQTIKAKAKRRQRGEI